MQLWRRSCCVIEGGRRCLSLGSRSGCSRSQSQQTNRSCLNRTWSLLPIRSHCTVHRGDCQPAAFFSPDWLSGLQGRSNSGRCFRQQGRSSPVSLLDDGESVPSPSAWFSALSCPVWPSYSLARRVLSRCVHRADPSSHRRRGGAVDPPGLLQITGLSGLPNVDATTAWAVILTVGLAMVAIVIYLTTWRRRTRLDWFVLLAAAIVVLGMFSSPELYHHYAYSPAPVWHCCLASV